MFENIVNFIKNLGKKEEKKQTQSESSKDAAKERLHLVLMQECISRFSRTYETRNY